MSKEHTETGRFCPEFFSLPFASGIAFEMHHGRGVNNPVTDGIRNGRVLDDIESLGNGNLQRNDCGLDVAAILCLASGK